LLLACTFVLAVLAAALLWSAGTRTGESQAAAVNIGGPFALIDQHGHRITDRDFHGRFVLLYFGYTYCPDVCPTTLALMANVLERLGPRAARIVPVFVTIDPERDTPAVLKSYLASFGPRFVGLTGSSQAIARAAHAYRVYYAKHPLDGGGYAMDHSSVVYLLAPDGRFVKVYDDQTPPAALATDLRARL
jgi:protein SCO1/2